MIKLLPEAGAEDVFQQRHVLLYLHDRCAHYTDRKAGGALSGRMLRIAVPLALSAYTRSALSTLQHLLVPRGLRSSGLTADAALAGYGVVQGMVMPLLFFPSCLLSSASELIVPELTAHQVQGRSAEIRNTAGELLRLSLRYSLAVSGILFCCADLLGGLIFHSTCSSCRQRPSRARSRSSRP